MICVNAYFLEVVVFSAGADAFLAVGGALVLLIWFDVSTVFFPNVPVSG
jgi:hypothetical protein